MNKQTIILGLLFMSLFLPLSSLMISPVTASTTSTTHTNSYWIEGGHLILQGDRPTSSSPMSIVVPLSTYNASQDIILGSHSWSEEDLAPSDFGTSGVTRTYSSTYAGRVTQPSLLSARSIYHTLRVIDENSFLEHSREIDSNLMMLYTSESVYDVVNRTMEGYGLFAENFTAATAHLQMEYNKEPVDSFFRAMAQDPDYATIAEDYFASTTRITDLTTKYFRESMLDLIYSFVNLTGYGLTDTIASKAKSDITSVTNATVHGSIRNAATGYIGYYLSGDDIDVPDASLLSKDNGDWFVSIEETDTQYLLNFNIGSNFISSSSIVQGFGMALTQIFPEFETVVVDDDTTAIGFPFYVHFLVAFVLGLISAFVAYTVEDKKKMKQKSAWKTFLIVFLVILGFMVIGFPVISFF